MMNKHAFRNTGKWTDDRVVQGSSGEYLVRAGSGLGDRLPFD